MDIKLDITKTVDENATTFFETAKKAKKKLVGARETLEHFKKKEEETSNEEISVQTKITKLSSEKKRWFEKFKWFISSNGYLVIAGRDATTNEIIIKKHTSSEDIVFHTDMAGSPFVVIKNEGSDVDLMLSQPFEKKESIPEQTILEGASFTFVHSKAWKLGLGSSAIFWVLPEQVSKEANTGEYMSKGSFMIRGKTNYVQPETRFACGVVRESDAKNGQQFFLAGPLSAVEHFCDHVIEIEQGNEKTSQVAKTVRSFLKEREEVDVSLDEIIASLPSGGCQVKKVRKRKEDLKPKAKKKRK